MSLTVILKLQLSLLPALSRTEQVTAVAPFAKREPLEGTHVTTGLPQLSLAETVYSTAASHLPGSVLRTMSEGQAITGFSASLVVIVKLQVFVFPLESVALQFTVDVPTAKTDPDGGVQITVAPGQLSATGTEKFTVLSHRPGAVFSTMFVGQLSAGGS